MATLKFYAREDLLVTEPGIRPMVGGIPRRVGRAFVAPTATTGAQHPATREPFECAAGSADAERLAFLVRRDASLWPADKATAEACGVPFVAVEFNDGVWTAKAPLRAVKEAV